MPVVTGTRVYRPTPLTGKLTLAQREALTWAADGFIETFPVATGALPGFVLTQLEASAGQYYRNFSTANQVVENAEIWAQIRSRAPGIVFKNCKIHGPDPRLLTAGTQYGMIKAYDGHYFTQFIDCEFDPLPWVTERGAPNLFRSLYGIHGHDVSLIRTEITNVQDGINIVGDPTSVSGGTAGQQLLVDWCWIHKGLFANGLTSGPTDLRTHSDPIQFNTGKNITIRRTYTGGRRDMTGYQVWGLANQPTTDVTKGRNTGEDFWNTGLAMIQQESDDGVDRRIENVLIEDMIVGGGTSGINFYYDSALGPTNLFASTTIRRIRFLQRGSDFGRSRSVDGSLTNVGGGGGFYMVRSPQIAASISDLTIYETGATAPVVVQ